MLLACLIGINHEDLLLLLPINQKLSTLFSIGNSCSEIFSKHILGGKLTSRHCSVSRLFLNVSYKHQHRQALPASNPAKKNTNI